MSRRRPQNRYCIFSMEMVTNYAMRDELSYVKCVARVTWVKGLTLSACPAIHCTCLPGPVGGPSGRGLHMAEFLKN
jgi:hypothetical protein